MSFYDCISAVLVIMFFLLGLLRDCVQFYISRFLVFIYFYRIDGVLHIFLVWLLILYRLNPLRFLQIFLNKTSVFQIIMGLGVLLLLNLRSYAYSLLLVE